MINFGQCYEVIPHKFFALWHTFFDHVYLGSNGVSKNVHCDVLLYPTVSVIMLLHEVLTAFHKDPNRLW